jgi:membrane protease YdiL (CAAX protease family)
VTRTLAVYELITTVLAALVAAFAESVVFRAWVYQSRLNNMTIMILSGDSTPIDY